MTLDDAFWLGLLGLSIAAAVGDIRRFRIPNALPAAVVGLFAVRVAVLGLWHEALWSVLVAAIVLAVGFGLFVMRWLGGGDVKLIAAISLWAGPEQIFLFVYTIALTGGVMALGLLVSLTLAVVSAKLRGKEGQRRPLRGQRLPYGVAIAVGALYLSLGHLGVL
ncbi:MAG: prepilin peptidase [Rhodospirillaceae bacterium]|nr:prepilin peptidase [Rhodospirillaceae bacterium]